MDGRQIHLLASIRSALFFLFLFGLTEWLKGFGVFILFSGEIFPIYLAALFFPAWEYFYLPGRLYSKNAHLFWSLGFLILIGSLFDASFAFYFALYFFGLAFFEFQFKKIYKQIIFLFSLLGILFPVFWVLFFPLSFLIPKKNCVELEKYS